jgi:hypothetical protein
VAVQGYLIGISWFIWDKQLNPQLIFREVALIAYWGAPFMEWCGWRISTLTGYSELG